VLDKSLVFKQAEDCLVENMDGEILLFNPTSQMTLHLNAPSVIVWELCDGQRSVQQIIDQLVEAYPQQADQIDTDVQEVINNFVQQKIVLQVDGL
jgi:hypothetical protein